MEILEEKMYVALVKTTSKGFNQEIYDYFMDVAHRRHFDSHGVIKLQTDFYNMTLAQPDENEKKKRSKRAPGMCVQEDGSIILISCGVQLEIFISEPLTIK